MSDLGMQRSERAYVKQRGGNDATVALRNSAASAGGAVIRTHGNWDDGRAMGQRAQRGRVGKDKCYRSFSIGFGSLLWGPSCMRRMVPHKGKRGAAALERLKCFDGVPAPYDKVKRLVVPDALKALRLQQGHRFCKLGDLSTSVSAGRSLKWAGGRGIARQEPCGPWNLVQL